MSRQPDEHGRWVLDDELIDALLRTTPITIDELDDADLVLGDIAPPGEPDPDAAPASDLDSLLSAYLRDNDQ